MDPIGLSLGVLSQADAIVQRLRQRFQYHRDNAEKLDAVHTLLEENTTTLKECEELMKDNGLASSPKICRTRQAYLNRIKKNAKSTRGELNNLERKYFDASSLRQDSSLPQLYQENPSSSESSDEDEGNACLRARRKVKQFTRARAIAQRLAKAERAAEKVEQNVNLLASELRITASRKSQPLAQQDVFRPRFFKSDGEHVVLDFSSSSTREGRLKAMLSKTCAATAYGFHGFGKLCTCAKLKEFTDLPDVKAMFGDHTYFMSFGSEVTEEKVIEQIVDLINASTTRENFAKVDDFSSAKDAAEFAGRHLTKKPHLIVCDDLFSKESDCELFADITLMLNRRPKSAIVVATENVVSADRVNCEVLTEADDLRARLLWFVKTYGIEGQGGVGKTVAMTGVASDPDIEKKFSGGIYFMSFGEEATSVKVIEEIKKIVEHSGGIQCAQHLDVSQSVGQVARTASDWFSENPCLFLCDDLWEMEPDANVFLDLKILINGHPGSRMVMTTRDGRMVCQTGFQFSYRTLERKGDISKKIFLEHSRIHDNLEDREFQKNLGELLRLCCGLPLLLAVVGTRLAQEERQGNVNDKLKIQVEEFESNILKETAADEYNKSLYAAVKMSVNFLDKNKSKRPKNDKGKLLSFSKMFRSLSILSKQGWIPVSALARLWEISEENAKNCITQFNRLRLVTFVSDKRNEKNALIDGVTLHDLTLDICRMDAAAKAEECWHEELLKRYCAFEKKEPSFEFDSPLGATDIHRPWWTVKRDGYIHSSLSRHLVEAGKQRELWGLLLNPSWSRFWIKGPFLQLETDLILLIEGMKRPEVKRILEKSPGKLEELQLIYKALRCAWGRIQEHPKEYAYQMLGRLYGVNPFVDSFLKSVAYSAKRPWLRPLNQCLEDSREGPEIEIHLKSPKDSPEDSSYPTCSSVAYFPKGGEVAAAVGEEVHVIDAHYGTLLRRYIGHRLRVRKVAVTSDWIVSADDEDIRIWSSRNVCQMGPEIACRNLTRPKDGSLVIREGGGIFATVKQGLKAWELKSGKEINCNYSQPANFIAFCAEGKQLICASSREKTVTVLRACDMTAAADPMTCTPDHGKISCLAVSPDGKSIAVGTKKVEPKNGEPKGYDSDNGRIVFWDRNSDGAGAKELSGHIGIVVALQISEDAKLFSGSNKGDVRMWDLKHPERPGKLIGRHTNVVTSVAASPDRTRLVSGSLDGTMRVWDVTKSTFANNRNLRNNRHSGPITCITSTPDGRFVITGSEDREVRVWNAETGELEGEPLIGHDDTVTEVRVNEDSSIVHSWSGEAICWNLETREECQLVEFEEVKDAGVSCGLISVEEKKNKTVECYYGGGGEQNQLLAKLPAQAMKLQWHIDRKRSIVYVGRQDGRIMILKLEST